eukprot:279985_1
MSTLFNHFKCLTEKPNEKPSRTSLSPIPMIALVNGLSGGHKGEKVERLLARHKIATFDLFKLSTNESYFGVFIEHFCAMYDGIIKEEEEYTDKGDTLAFSLHPRILIGGGDGSIAWALSILDRALLDEGLLRSFWQRARAHDDIQKDLKASIKELLSIETTVSNEFYYAQQYDSDSDNGSHSYNFVATCDSPYSSSASLSAQDEEQIVEEFMNQKLSMTNTPQKRRCDDESKLDDIEASLVTREEIESVIRQKESAALFNNQQSNQELRILQGIYDCRIAPSIALLPLGTGNDLSRCLGTGFVYPGSKELTQHLLCEFQKANAPITKLDRWKIVFLDTHQTLKPRQTSELLCYFSVGFEGQIAYKFQCARSKNPKLFDRPWKNKMQYILSGIGAGVEEALGITKPLNSVIECWVDGERLKLPSNTRSLVISNIQSMADGVYFWGKGPDTKKDVKRYSEPQLGDAKLEVMAAKGIYKYLQLRVGVSHYRRLAQPKKVTIIMKQELPIQVDGESWIESKGIIQIYLLHQVFAVVGKNEPRGVQIM